MKDLTIEIRNFLRSIDLPFVTASMAEDYIKRFLEGKYNQLEKTDFFKRLKTLEQKEKFLIEIGLYCFNAYLKKKMNFRTPAGVLFRGIVTDFFPEMGKRLINGDNSPDPEEQEIIELVRSQENESLNLYEPKYEPKEEKTKKEKPVKMKNSGALDDLVKPARERMIEYLSKPKKGGGDEGKL